MVLRIFKMNSTSGFLTALECTKLVIGQSSAPDPTGELTALPRTLQLVSEALLLSAGGKGKGREEGERKGTGGTVPL